MERQYRAMLVGHHDLKQTEREKGEFVSVSFRVSSIEKKKKV